MGVERLAEALVQNQNRPEESSDLLYGLVVSSAPLKIKVDNRFVVGGNQLVLTTPVRELTVPCTCTGGGTVKVFENLKNGEKVLLIRVKRGQQYIVLDRVRG